MSNLCVTQLNKSATENKIILIGNAGVGKTSIIDRYTKGVFFHQSTHKTLDHDVVRKTVRIEGKNYMFVIWDTAGQELYRSVTRTHYHDAKGIFLVYDVSAEESIRGLEYWTKELTGYGLFDPSTCIILANKCDLIGLQHTKPVCELDRDATFLHIPLKYETSAKDGKGIDAAFQKMCENIVDKPGTVSCDEHYSEILSKQVQYPSGSCFCK